MSKLTMLNLSKSGVVTETVCGYSPEDWTDMTLLGALYEGVDVALVTVPTSKTRLEMHEDGAVRNAMSAIKFKDKIYYLIGSGGGAKNGKFYAVAQQDYAKSLELRYQSWPEAACTYMGILTSPCNVIKKTSAKVLVVPDNELGTNDCRGWISKTLFSQLGLPEGHFYQFRLAFGGIQAKGSFKVASDETMAYFGVDIIIPESSIKPAVHFSPFLLSKIGFPGGRRIDGEVVIGIMNVSHPSEYEGSYTVAQFASWEVIEKEIIPKALQQIEKLSFAMNDKQHSEIVKMIGSKNRDGEYRVVEAALLADGSGELAQHPYVHKQMDKLLAQWAYKVCTGGGMRMPAFALADDGYLMVKDGKLITGSDWLPMENSICGHLTSRQSLCVRYPVRMLADLLPMVNLTRDEVVDILCSKQGLEKETAEAITDGQILLESTYTLNSQKAKLNGGDFDFDVICVIDEDVYPKFVDQRFAYTPTMPSVVKTKGKRLKSPWWNLPAVALSATGNEIGSITNINSGAIANDRIDIHKGTSVEMQAEIDKMKHGGGANTALLNQWKKELIMPIWLDLKDPSSITQLPVQIDALPTDRIGYMYNRLRSAISIAFDTPMTLLQFAGIVTGHLPSKQQYIEAKSLVRFYNFAFSQISDKLETARFAYNKYLAAFIAAKKEGNSGKIKEAREALSMANAALISEKDSMATRAKQISQFVKSWARGKRGEERFQFLQALNDIVTKGSKGTGSILFTAFQQEYVDCVATRTNGKSVQVVSDNTVGVVLLKNDYRDYYFVGVNGAETFLFRFEYETKKLVRTLELAA